MTAAFNNHEPVIEVGQDWIDRLKQEARGELLRRSRLCLHHGNDAPLHEMVIVHHHESRTRPHRHIGKSESLHCIEGELDVVFFDDVGRPNRVIRLGSPAAGRTLLYRIDAPLWHTVLVRSEYAVIHEVTDGPFDPTAGEFAPWAPAEPDVLNDYLVALETLCACL